MAKASLMVLMAAPRGFCAGVERAILIVERALAVYGAPVYVRHEIVHNRHVVEDLRRRGAVFVKEVDEVPAGAPVVFSAHGVARSVPEAAAQRGLMSLDATCPLVSKVHAQAGHLHRTGYHILLIGHAGHPEVIGTMGQLPTDAIDLIETIDDIAALPFAADHKLAYITQTTLSVDDTARMIEALRARYPDIQGPTREDICYATTNRQDAVKAIAPRVEMMLVVGAAHSSNSRRLVEVAEAYGAQKAFLINDASCIDWAWLDGVQSLGLSSGASAPEHLVQGVLAALGERFDITIETIETAREDIFFRLPRELEVMPDA